MIHKPTPGTGASLLVDVLAGVFCNPILTPLPDGEAEQRYTLLAVLRKMPDVVVLDNVKELNGAALASLFTSTRFSGRIVGSSDVDDVENNATWFATANNPNLNDEMTRRAVSIWLDAGVDHPEDRRDFRHSDLKKWARENRPGLIQAALTIIQYWFQAGRPLSTKGLGSFESWAQIMGGILETAEIDGFLGNVESFRSRVDPQTQARVRFVRTWGNQFDNKEVTVGDLRSLALESGVDLGRVNELSQSIRLGKLLSDKLDQCVDSWIIKKGGFVSGCQRWRLEKQGK
jgi:hypothetical protein